MRLGNDLLGGEGRKVLLFLLLVAGLGVGALLLGPTSMGRPAAATAPQRDSGKGEGATGKESAESVAVSPARTALGGLNADSAVPSYDDPATGALSDSGGPAWTDVVGLLVKLGLVLALLIIALKGLQRLSGSKGRAASGQRSIDVLETAPLAQGTNVYLVSVGGKVLLLGGTTQQVNLLTEIDDPAILARVQPPEATPPPDFNRLVSEIRQRVSG